MGKVTDENLKEQKHFQLSHLLEKFPTPVFFIKELILLSIFNFLIVDKREQVILEN